MIQVACAPEAEVPAVSSDDWRTFRIDRIERVTAGDRFSPRPPPDDGDLGAYVSRSVSISPYAGGP